MKFYHKKGTEVSTLTKSIYYLYTIVYISNIQYISDFQHFGFFLEKILKNETYPLEVRKHHQTNGTMKTLFLAIMMYYNNGDLNADNGVPHYGSFTVVGTRHCLFNEDGTIKSCDDKEKNGYVTYSLEDSSVVVNMDDDYKDYEIIYVKYDEDGDWMIITKTKGNRDYWCFHFNIDLKQVMLSQVRSNKIVYEGCLMFYFGNYIIG